jgi:non-specific serine/threonine protein kinase
VELVGAAAALRLTAPAQRSPREQRWLEGYLAGARRALSARGAERALRAGALLRIARAVERALDLRIGATHDPDDLSAREQQVAMLVARGLSNPQIARELGIGDRTVQTHVGNVLAKLGLDSRVQIAAWVTEHRLASRSASAKNP